jgi:hypothetical protein
MKRINLFRVRMQQLFLGVATLVLCVLLSSSHVSAQFNPIPPPDDKPGGYGLEATKKQAPPSLGASITVPGNGASFTESPITVQGICPTDLLVQVYNNNVMVGAVVCENGSFSLQVSLFSGTNDLKAIVYDDLDQPGPESNTVTVTYANTNFTAFGQLVTLTSNYGRRSAPAGTQLTWPLQLSGGTGPYAFSIDWGDGSEPQLMSQSLAGAFNIAHTYKNAGIYQINIRVTDANGVSAFLQLIAVSSGEVKQTTGQSTDDSNDNTAQRVRILWIPAAVALILLIPTYWLGKRSQLVILRNQMLKERDAFEKKK